MIAALTLVTVLAGLHAQSVDARIPPRPFRAPYAIAHRGLSGVFPEHTARAYQEAIKAGADFIECDIVPTKDCSLICRHENDLAVSTDVLEKFPELRRTVNIDGRDFTSVFSFDLTLEQVRQVRARQQVTIRDQQYNGQFGVITLQEFIDIAQAAPRVVGIYPETKNPSFHDSLNLACFNGKSFTEAVLDVLSRNGYTGAVGTPAWRRRPAFLQSFERKNLLAVANQTDLPLVFLTSGFGSRITGDDITYGEAVTPAGLAELFRGGIRGIGPSKTTLVGTTSGGRYNDASTIAAGKELVRRIQAAGFQVHIYTLRNEAKRPDNSGYLPFDFQADPYLEYDLFFQEIGVDGAFTDQVGSLARYLA